MDSLFIVWFVFSIALFFTGFFIYRRGLSLVLEGGSGIAVDPGFLRLEEECVRMTSLYNESLAQIERLTQEKDLKISQLETEMSLKEGRHSGLVAAKDEVINILKNDQDKLRNQLAEEKKYSEQSSDDYRNQIRNLDQTLDRLRSGEKITSQEKEIEVNKLREEKDAAIVRYEEILRKSADMELKLQEAQRIIQDLQGESDEQTSDDKNLKGSLQKSIILIKELKADNERLSDVSADFRKRSEQMESFNQNLEEKGRQLQYELVKSRAQLMGLEQICDDLRKKIEQLTVS